MNKNIFDLMDFGKLFENLDTSMFKLNNEVIDLASKEGLDKFNKKLDELEENEFGKLFLEHITGKKIYELRDLAKNYYDINNPKDVKVDESLKEVKQDLKELPKKEFDRPSKHIDINVGLQIHKLVQEYIDTKIKPYAKGIMSEKSINDAYAGLYEFACWIYNKPSNKK